MEIKIPSPEEINRQITEAVAKSAIGDALREVVEKEVKRLGDRYDSPLRMVVQKEIDRILTVMLREEKYTEQFRKVIDEALATKLTSEMIDQVLNVAFDRMLREH